MTNQINNEAIYTKQTFNEVVYEEQQIEGAVFRDCRFIKSNFNNCVFIDCSFENCIFDGCDLSLIKVKSTGFNKVILKNTKAIGVNWSEAASPFSMHFEHCKISYCSFFGKNLKKAQFLHCLADEVDFSECQLEQSNFRGTDLRKSIFHNTDLSMADFIDARHYFINIHSNKIAKAKFSLPDALVFLQALGIELHE